MNTRIQEENPLFARETRILLRKTSRRRIKMRQDIYDLTVAYILENQEKFYRLAYSYVQYRDSACLLYTSRCV